MRDIAITLQSLHSQRAQLEAREELGEPEMDGLSRISRCKLSRAALEGMFENYSSDLLAGDNLKTLRKDAQADAEIPELEICQHLVDPRGFRPTYLPPQPDWASVIAHNRKQVKWVALLLQDPLVDDTVAFLILYGCCHPIYVVLAPLRHLPWPPQRGELSHRGLTLFSR